MYINNSSKQINKPVEASNGWDACIAMANTHIETAKKRIKRLKSNIKLWEEMRDSGAKWPGFEKATGGVEKAGTAA